MDIKLEPVDQEYDSERETTNNMWYEVPIEPVKVSVNPIKSEMSLHKTKFKEEVLGTCSVKLEPPDSEKQQNKILTSSSSSTHDNELSSPVSAKTEVSPTCYDVNQSTKAIENEKQSNLSNKIDNNEEKPTKNDSFNIYKPFKCGQCDYKAVQLCFLKRHSMLHSGEKPFKCDECDFKSAYSYHLKTHKMLHSGGKPFKCDLCDFKSAKSSNLKTHKMSHTGERPFKCDQCGFKSVKSSDLKIHKIAHTGEKPFICDQCDFKSAHPGNLKKHKMTHSGEKPFKCDLCNFKAAHSSNLKRHRLLHALK